MSNNSRSASKQNRKDLSLETLDKKPKIKQ